MIRLFLLILTVSSLCVTTRCLPNCAACHSFCSCTCSSVSNDMLPLELAFFFFWYPRSYLLHSLMTIVYKVISPIFTCRFIWVRKLVRFCEVRTQIEGVRNPGKSIWIQKTGVLYKGAEE
jgi:hypothetical protein